MCFRRDNIPTIPKSLAGFPCHEFARLGVFQPRHGLVLFGRPDILFYFSAVVDDDVGADAVFMVNLYPSYADLFRSGGYSDYLKSYCETVLSQVEGKKYLSVDSYAIRADKQLETYLLYDIAMVKKYSLEYDTLSHICLQSSMTSVKNRIPEQSEYAVQAYAALALGMDSISWYTYITPEEDGYGDGSAPVNQNGTKNAAYEALKKVNNDIAAFGYAYKCFDWKGVVLNPVTQTSAMNLILKTAN